MPNFVIERVIPGATEMTEDQVNALAKKSLGKMQQLGIQWLHSYVTDDKVYCIYWAPDAEVIQRHANEIYIPANRIAAVKRLKGPATAD
jgi:hypothetical protein